MRLLTESATLQCIHGAVLQVTASQRFVRIDGQAVLTRPVPAGGLFTGCPNTNVQAGQKPCLTPMPPLTGYSALVTINGLAVCTDGLNGLTDSTPPASYRAAQAGQAYVSTGL